MYRMISLVLALSLLTGCQSIINYNIEKENASEAVYSMTESIDLSYEIPISKPNILVNQEGYRVGSKKIAIFHGEQLPQNFYVMDMATRKQVYSGRIEGKGQGQGNFTDLDLPGEYYIEADDIGQSYSFKIGSHLYENAFEKACDQFTKKEKENYQKMSVEDICYILTNLLTAYELYKEEFDLYIPEFLVKLKDYTDSLLAVQDMKTGKISSGSSDNVTAHAAAVLSKYSYLYKNLDSGYANECYKASNRAWGYLSKTKGAVEESYRFYAAAELFRISGNSTYHMIVKEYLEKRTAIQTGIHDLGFYGEVTYLVTPTKVDVELCDKIMNRIMDEAEVISEKAGSQSYLISADMEQENVQDMLDMMVKMAVVDYVISNHEYATVLENHLHYLLGRNPQSVSYIEGNGKVFTDRADMDILSNPRYNSSFIFMMSAIEKHEEDGE